MNAVKEKARAQMAKCREFIAVRKLYARHHGPIYSARIAYGVAFRGLPF